MTWRIASWQQNDISRENVFEVLHCISLVFTDALIYPFVDVKLLFQECGSGRSYDIFLDFVDMLILGNVIVIPMEV